MDAMRPAVILALAAAAACATDGAKDAVAAAATLSSSEGVLLGRLNESNLPKGECGMVLWTLDQREPAPIFRYIAGKSAEIVVGTAPIGLTLIESSGPSAYGVSERQRFVDASQTLRVGVEVKFALEFDGGAYLERGIVAVESANGWRTVAPSAGLAGCRSR